MKARTLGSIALVAVLPLCQTQAIAQARIVESRPMRQSEPTPSPVSALYNQLQLLQEEVSQLRGLVEQQSYELKQLKQQRLDDYLDLDGRLSRVGSVSSSSSSAVAVSQSPGASPQVRAAASSSPTRAPADELAAYRAAIDLVLKQQNLEGGSAALKSYLQNFPNPSYGANANYWLGEIYSQQKSWREAALWFEKLLTDYPSYYKADEARYKLGRAYLMDGNAAKGRSLLQDLAASESSTAGMARTLLEQNP